MPNQAINGLDEIMDGAVTERYEHELRQVVKNMLDPNTDAKKVRKISLNIAIYPNENRDIADFSIEAKSTLAPRTPIKATLYFGIDSDGEVVAREYKRGVAPGQLDMEGKEHGNIVPLTKIK